MSDKIKMELSGFEAGIVIFGAGAYMEAIKPQIQAVKAGGGDASNLEDYLQQAQTFMDRIISARVVGDAPAGFNPDDNTKGQGYDRDDLGESPDY